MVTAVVIRLITWFKTYLQSAVFAKKKKSRSLEKCFLYTIKTHGYGHNRCSRNAYPSHLGNRDMVIMLWKSISIQFTASRRD